MRGGAAAGPDVGHGRRVVGPAAGEQPIGVRASARGRGTGLGHPGRPVTRDRST